MRLRGPDGAVGGLSRRELFGAGLAGAGALLSACAGPGAWSTRLARPHLLLLLTDDQHHRAVGYASGGRVATPHLDRLAAGGAIFTDAYAAAVPCAPSRGCLMTGLHYHRWRRGAAFGGDRLAPGEWTWAHALRGAGYATALIGKMHFGPMRAYHGFEHAEYCEHAFSRKIARGQRHADDYEQWLQQFGLRDWQNANRPPRGAPGQFEEFRRNRKAQPWPHDPETHPISWVRDRAIAYLEARRGDARPHCLAVSFRYPHAPYNPSPRFAARVDPDAVELPAERWTDMRDMPPGLAHLAGLEPFGVEALGEAALRLRFAYYDALVAQIDDAVGAVLRHVDLTNTLVLFTSDHGTYRGARGRVGKHPFVGFEPVARVPLLASGRGVPAGAVVTPPVSLVDLAPTLLVAAGIEPPPELDGRPLQEHFRNAESGRDRAVTCLGTSGFDAIRRARIKYFESIDGSERMLFDLASDPGEWENLARAARWRGVLEDLAAEMARVRGRPPANLPRFPAPAPA